VNDSSKDKEVVVIFTVVIHDNPAFNNVATDSMTEIVNFAIEFRTSNQQRYQLQIVMLIHVNIWNKEQELRKAQ
jgi:TRAP-type uncharacterized transport system substrate-binding protein